MINSNQTFEEQFPDYALVPSKESKFKAPLILAMTVAALALCGYALFRELGQLNVPLAAMAGVDQNTVATLKSLALTQAQAGQYRSAAKNFDDYFKLGGHDEDAVREAERVKAKLQDSGN